MYHIVGFFKGENFYEFHDLTVICDYLQLQHGAIQVFKNMPCNLITVFINTLLMLLGDP